MISEANAKAGRAGTWRISGSRGAELRMRVEELNRSLEKLSRDAGEGGLTVSDFKGEREGW